MQLHSRAGLQSLVELVSSPHGVLGSHLPSAPSRCGDALGPADSSPGSAAVPGSAQVSGRGQHGSGTGTGRKAGSGGALEMTEDLDYSVKKRTLKAHKASRRQLLPLPAHPALALLLLGVILHLGRLRAHSWLVTPTDLLSPFQ